MTPGFSMTYADLKLRVAERAVLIKQDASTNKTVALTSQPAADRIERAIRDGVEEFYRATDWSFLLTFLEFVLDAEGDTPANIAGSNTRYILPSFIESLPKPGMMVKYEESTTPGGHVTLRMFQELVERAYLEPNTTGFPEAVAVQFNPMLNPQADSRGGLEMRVWPQPDQAYTLGFLAKVGPVPFLSDSQRGRWPAVHDLTVVAFAVRELFRHDRESDNATRDRAETEVSRTLGISITRDNEDFRPISIGARGELSWWPRGRRVELFDYVTNQTLVSTDVYSR